MHFHGVVISIFIFVNNIRTIVGGLTISGVQCGVKRCRVGEYCSEFERICAPCASICDQNHHNFDESQCVKSCQDYIHDMRYLQRNSSGFPEVSLDKLKGDVQALSQMVTVTLTLVCFMFVVLAAVLGFQLYRWKLKKNITLKNLKSKLFKKSETGGDLRMEDPANKNHNNVNEKPDLRLDISNISTVSEHSPVTAVTSISTRRPAEDSALDYAYDNHAMSSSPK